MAYTDIDKPSDYFETKLYTGNAGTQNITGLDFQPDWIWVKDRTGDEWHNFVDSVRGTTKYLFSNANNAENTNSNRITSFNSDGFSLGNDVNTNFNSRNFASWNWKAGTSFTNDASGTGIGSIDSTGSVNTDAGFSIISYTGTGSAGTVAHGLAAVPKMIIIKSRNTVSLWGVYHQAIGNTHGLFLNATNAATSLSAYWNNTSPTSSVFSLGGDADINKSSDPLIAYCFAEKQGYSKFGSYVGNGNADGTFIYTGFKTAFLIVKNTTEAGNGWQIFDNKRDTFNVATSTLFSNLNNAEGTDTSFDVLSNGIKMRQGFGSKNKAANVYIYMAFAEESFVSSSGVPATAR